MTLRTLAGIWGRYCLSLPSRYFIRNKIRNSMALPETRSNIESGTMAGVLRIKNEDYWIELILRTTCKVLDEVIVIDSGSQDQTISIITQLQQEGLNIQLFQHTLPPRFLNPVVNMLLDSVVVSEYYYLIDGDEIQIAPYLEQTKEIVASIESEHIWRLAYHHLFVHPHDFTQCTKPFCKNVRYSAGRILNRRKLRMSEIMINDGTEKRNTLPFLNQTDKSKFLDEAFAIHCPLNQRSTIKGWQGNAEVNPNYAGQYRATRYIAEPTDYIPLPFFPKEILECKYSLHNHYMTTILDAQINLI